jgi:hypothetical protein
VPTSPFTMLWQLDSQFTHYRAGLLSEALIHALCL